ncbi:MAG: hypothetical protein FWE80_07630, partial [Oscillospiraceae bacterium]|nr:hypothetical protein [Oscillospiraceae bacterium]
SWSSRNEFRKYIDEYYDILPAVYIFTNVGLDSYQIQVSLGELLPKTTGMVINYKNPYTLSVMHDKVTAYRPSEYDMPFMIFPLNLGSGFTGYPVYMSPTLSQCDWIAEMIAMSFDRDIDISKPCMVIKYENTVAYFQVPDEYLAMVKKWYN